MISLGAEQILAKKLAPNDNSKNQIYLGSGFSALKLIPHGEIFEDRSVVAGSKRPRPKAPLNFLWLNEGKLEAARFAQLILYPDYPEVRLSGLLRGTTSAPNRLVASRSEDRILILGTTRKKQVIGYIFDSNSPLYNEFHAERNPHELGIFTILGKNADSKNAIIRELTSIHNNGWLPSVKLGKNGVMHPYKARNGGGYTLEAHLGIYPNGIAEPDFLDWEVKQYSVRNFKTYAAKTPVTLMTPEPTGGHYRLDGASSFVRKYGYVDKNGVADRLNFGGIYRDGMPAHKDTKLRLVTQGFDKTKSVISDFDGTISLLTDGDEVAASWAFKDLLSHWTTKHARTAYIPSLNRGPPPEYKFGAKISLYEEPDFIYFLRAVASGKIYYDPAIKLENASTENAKVKSRSQFRVTHKYLNELYREETIVMLE